MAFRGEWQNEMRELPGGLTFQKVLHISSLGTINKGPALRIGQRYSVPNKARTSSYHSSETVWLSTAS